ncbi:hypothetical protein HDV00_000434 [Rhizophlyctis rosea]|nr:hypothetical protein HDV00_000434 [Rhizophlyctis rosea]
MQSDEKINSSHYKATCKACVSAGVPEDKCSITGIGDSMKNHLLKCPNTPEQEKERVQALSEQILAEQAAHQHQQQANAANAAVASLSPLLQQGVQTIPVFNLTPTTLDMKRKPLSTPPSRYQKRSRYDDIGKPELDGFEKQLLRATVSANLPLSWVEDPEVRKVMEQIRPGLHMPSKRALENRILKLADEEIKFRGDTYIRNTRNFTVSMGAWDDGKGRQLTATNVITAERKLVPAVDVAEMSVDALSGEEMVVAKLRVILERLDRFENSTCVALITDPTSEFRKAKRLIGKERPALLGLDSGPGQVALMAAQLVRETPWIQENMANVVEVLELFNDHTSACFRLWIKQDEVNGHRFLIKTPNANDWTTFSHSTFKLLESAKAIRDSVTENRPAFLESFTASGKLEHANRILDLVSGDEFWARTMEFNRVFGQLERSYKSLRRSHSRLDAHFYTLAQLYQTYHADPDRQVADTVSRAVESRWEKMEQSLYILAYFLHPGNHLKNLNGAEAAVQLHNMVQYASKYYERLFQQKAEGLMGEIAKYYGKRTPFDPEAFNDRQLTADPVLFWDVYKAATPALSALALKLFSVCLAPESMAQMFDELDQVHDSRTLHPDKLSAFVRVKLQLSADRGDDSLKPEPIKTAPLTVTFAGGTPVLPANATVDDVAVGWEVAADYDDGRIAKPLKTKQDAEEFLGRWMKQLDREYDVADVEDSAAWGDEGSRCPIARLFVYPLAGEFEGII